MAGDWIKMRSNLWDDPRVTRLVDMTDSSDAAVIGGLYWLWATADQHSEDGVLHGMQPKTIDRKTGVAGLGEALISIGWVAEHPEGLRIVRFEEHNGESAKSRAQTARRVSKHTANARLTVPALSKQDDAVSEALAREREEKEKNKNKNDLSLSTAVPDQQAKAPADAVCERLKTIGISDTNPTSPTLIALLAQGITADELIAAGKGAHKRGKGFAYALKIAETQRRDAAAMAALPGKPASNEKPWYLAASGIEQEGARRGIVQGNGEVFPDFKARIYQAAGVTADMLRGAQADFGARA